MKMSLTCPLVVAFALSGCVAADVAPTVTSVEELLYQDPGEAAGRVLVRDFGDTRLGTTGPALAPRTVPYRWGAVGFHRFDDGEPSPPAVEIDGEILMIAESDEVRLLLSPDPADLHDVIRFAAEGGATYDGHRNANGEGVRWRAGTAVTRRAVDDELETVLVGVDDRFIQVEAWVAADAVGAIYDPWASDPSDFYFRKDVLLRSGVEVLDEPHGAVLAVVDHEGRVAPDFVGPCWFDGVRVVDRWADWTRLEIAEAGALLDGWVLTEDAVDGRWGCGRCGGVGFSRGFAASPVTLLAGTPLLDGPDGDVVGTVLADHYRRLGEPDEESWIPVKVDTLWGEATVWIDGLR